VFLMLSTPWKVSSYSLHNVVKLTRRRQQNESAWCWDYYCHDHQQHELLTFLLIWKTPKLLVAHSCAQWAPRVKHSLLWRAKLFQSCSKKIGFIGVSAAVTFNSMETITCAVQRQRWPNHQHHVHIPIL